ncbi:MAG: low molecular weight phosphatase family protein [Rhodospirillaceae bacterium]|nr:low molecular weight phosphatase family protein [Rhodospirillaceae bacterium]
MTASALPSSVLFLCDRNAIRSPMAAALLRSIHGASVWVRSAGVAKGEADPFAVAAMAEVDLDIAGHVPTMVGDLDESNFDLIVALSLDALLKAETMTRTTDCQVAFWEVEDPSRIEGSRDVRMDAYRSLRHALLGRILDRFPLDGAPHPPMETKIPS